MEQHIVQRKKIDGVQVLKSNLNSGGVQLTETAPQSTDMAIVTSSQIDDYSAKPPISIKEFFAHKNIFVTGGTGFLGTVLLEALLSASPDIGTIYVLVRGKHGFDPRERINRILQKPIFSKHSTKVLEKIVPIVGELSSPNFGFKEDIYNKLLENVHIIFHGAATIRFSAPLRIAIRINLTGTMRTIEFAKRLKNLSAYVYMSTAFCNSNNKGYIEERVYESHADPYEMMKMAEDDAEWENYTEIKCKEMIRDHPNTYTYTKNLAENLMVREMSGLPAGIVRPSIVYGTWEHPIKGWVGNANSGHLGFMAGFYKGVFRTMSGKPSSRIDVVPCDYVINSTLVMAWYAGTRKLEKPEVIHCTSGELNPLTLGEWGKLIEKASKEHPADLIVCKPCTGIRNGWRYTVYFFLCQIIPAMVYWIPEKIFGIGMPQHSVIEYMLVFRKGNKAFDYFLDKDFIYSLKNALRIMDLMNPEDKKRYSFDCRNCDWYEFMTRCLIGIRQYYFKESAETTSWHHAHYRFTEIYYYLFFVAVFYGLYALLTPVLGFTSGLILTLALWLFLVWL